MKRVITLAAVLAFSATAASAGGFRYASVGGNLGNWAYADGAAQGDAKVHGYGYGATKSESYANTNTGYTGYHSTGASAETGNKSSFKTHYGSGSAQSNSAAVAGSGFGTGIGGKLGSFSGGSGCGCYGGMN